LKYTNKVNEDEMIRYIYEYIEDSKKTNNPVIIKNISISNPKINDLWFNESTVNLSLYVSNEEAMFWFIKFLFKDDSKYKFFLSTLSYPIDKSLSWYSLSLPLRVFYK
jgi:hypothetical protein